MNKTTWFLASIIVTLSACSSIPIQNVEPDKLTVDVQLIQTQQNSQLDVYLKRGMFGQPVSLAGTHAEAVLDSGAVRELVSSRKEGRYGVQVRGNQYLSSLYLEAVGEVDFPAMAPVILDGRDQYEDGLFFKNDVLTIALRESPADTRYLVVTGFCGNNQYTSRQKISLYDNDLSLQLGRLMNKINQAAEADLNGIIPVTLAIEEHYQPVWRPPFRVKELVSKDETQFSVDTSGFRFKARVTVELAQSIFLEFQNQAWPVKYCY